MLVGAAVLTGVVQTASGGSVGRVRAGQSRQAQHDKAGGNLDHGHGRRTSNGAGAGGVSAFQGRYGEPHRPRSLKSTRDPQCNLPEAFPCTLNTTAIGMLESGFATYYDE